MVFILIKHVYVVVHTLNFFHCFDLGGTETDFEMLQSNPGALELFRMLFNY